MLIRIVANAIKIGGGERSVSTIARMLLARGHRVLWHPTTSDPFAPGMDAAVDPACELGPAFHDTSCWDCDLLFFCANNALLGSHDPRRRNTAALNAESLWREPIRAARRSLLLLNWEIGDAPRLAPLFDRIGFLSTFMQAEFCRICGFPAGRTFVHAPAVDLAPFLGLEPAYESLILVRHSYAPKWPAESARMIRAIHALRPEARFRTMGFPARLMGSLRGLPIVSHPAGSVPVGRLLAGSSAFWYPLRPDYREQGPRVLVEAMAAGLPCLVDDRDGPRDRVTPETGWRIARHADYAPLIARLTNHELREKGEAARERARTAFDPAHWADWMEEVAHA